MLPMAAALYAIAYGVTCALDLAFSSEIAWGMNALYAVPAPLVVAWCVT